MWHDSSKDIQYMYGYISSGCMCVLILEHAFYITGACVKRSCAFQGHQCDSLIVLELGYYETGLTASQHIRVKF